MSLDTASSRTVRAHLTACHGACIVRQQVRRQSLAGFVRVGWLRSRRSPSLARGGQLQLSLKLEAVLRQPT